MRELNVLTNTQFDSDFGESEDELQSDTVDCEVGAFTSDVNCTQMLSISTMQSYASDIMMCECCTKKCLIKSREGDAMLNNVKILLSEYNPSVYAKEEDKKIIRFRRNNFLAVALAMGIKDARLQGNDTERVSKNRLNSDLMLPYIGKVCRTIFCKILHLEKKKLHTYRQHAKEGNLRAPIHGLHKKNGNKLIQNNLQFKVTSWLLSLANSVGESSAVRIHRKKIVDGTVRKFTSNVDVTFLPTLYNSSMIYWEFIKDYHAAELQEKGISISRLKLQPSLIELVLCLNTFKSYWKSSTETQLIKIRKPTSDVCDECWTFKNLIRVQRDQEGFDLLYADHSDHVNIAAQMKEEYKID